MNKQSDHSQRMVLLAISEHDDTKKGLLCNFSTGTPGVAEDS
jgi:hypothetical protein